MQRDIKKTKITVREDWPVSTSSTIHGANINAVAFNLEYILQRDPLLALKLQKLYEQGYKLLGKPILDGDDPLYSRAIDNVIKHVRKKYDDHSN